MLFRVLDSSFWIVGSLNHGVNWELQSETLRLSVCIVMVPQWYVSQVYDITSILIIMAGYGAHTRGETKTDMVCAVV